MVHAPLAAVHCSCSGFLRPLPLTPRSRRTIVLAIGLAALAVLAVSLLLPPAALRLKTAYYLRELESGEEARLASAYRALTEELAPEVLHLLCDAAERSPSKPLYFQIARVIHARCGVPLDLEAEALPPPQELRAMVKRKFAADAASPGRNP